jgi:hypothetical protein
MRGMSFGVFLIGLFSLMSIAAGLAWLTARGEDHGHH